MALSVYHIFRQTQVSTTGFLPTPQVFGKEGIVQVQKSLKQGKSEDARGDKCHVPSSFQSVEGFQLAMIPPARTATEFGTFCQLRMDTAPSRSSLVHSRAKASPQFTSIS